KNPNRFRRAREARESGRRLSATRLKSDFISRPTFGSRFPPGDGPGMIANRSKDVKRGEWWPKVGGPMARRRVAMVFGFWGQNVGNAFFNIGGKWILEQVFPDHDVALVQDQPGYRTFHDQRKGNPRNDLELLQYIQADYLVLQGPMLTRTFR